MPTSQSPAAAFTDRPRIGNLFMVVAPSGAGKSTLVNALLARDARIALSVSTTTRAPRSSETDGREYHFVSVDEFKARRARGEFLESAEVHGNFYGTSRTWIENQMCALHDVLLEIDWQGARQVKAHFPHAIGIFILPPSLDALEARLHSRGQDSYEVIRRRLVAAVSEITHTLEFEYVIINEDFNVALAELTAIVTAARLRFAYQSARHHDLFMQLGIPQ